MPPENKVNKVVVQVDTDGYEGNKVFLIAYKKGSSETKIEIQIETLASGRLDRISFSSFRITVGRRAKCSPSSWIVHRLPELYSVYSIYLI